MTLLALLVCLLAQTADGEREALWREVARIRSEALPAAEAEGLRRQLVAATEDLPPGPRTELLRIVLAGLGGAEVGAAATRLDALDPGPFSSLESWFLVDVMPAGPARTNRVLTLLEDPAPLERWQLVVCWNVAVDEARALRLEQGALPIQARLHERYQADWSALDLALTLRKVGRREALEALFEDTLARARREGRPVPEVWAQRGIAAAGFGDERRARDYLGKALAEGSESAAVVLGRMDLEAGHMESARAGFRASILNLPPPDWSWRGWGTTLLPRAHEPAVLSRAASPQTPPTSR